MVIIPMVIILIAFWFSQHPVVLWVLIGTSILIYIALKILVSKYEAAHPYQGSSSRGGYGHRRSRRTGSAVGAFAKGVKQAHRRSQSARRSYHRHSGVRSSLIGLHRR